MDIIKKIASELEVQTWQAEAAVKLIDEGNTIPFIARYRKEATGTLDDEQLRKLYERLVYLRNLEDKKQQVLASIEEQGKLTEELRKQILEAQTQVLVEDLYRPYRPKRRTRATIAKEKGLEGLANIILLQMTRKTLEEEASVYLSEEKDVLTVQDAINGAKDIIAEMISDNANLRKELREALSRAETAVVLTPVLALLELVGNPATPCAAKKFMVIDGKDITHLPNLKSSCLCITTACQGV